ncbi:MAG: imidazole glycerol phosphate synthase subunit HisF [Wenzhouxiangellaceae bacterium]
MSLARRLIPCLDVRDGRVVKGVRFRNHADMGDIVELALRYRSEGADELVFYDITASPEGRSVDRDWISRVSAAIDIPFCVAGGIRDLVTAEAVLRAGADKISVNTPALERPALIDELAHRFGSQCVVIGVDSYASTAGYRLKQYTGDPDKMREANRDTHQWIREVVDRGAGEIVLNCMDADGVRQGYDIAQLAMMRELCPVPLIASGGAGEISHFIDVFRQADVDGALAATVFHSGHIPIPELKQALKQANIQVRP